MLCTLTANIPSDFSIRSKTIFIQRTRHEFLVWQSVLRSVAWFLEIHTGWSVCYSTKGKLKGSRILSIRTNIKFAEARVQVCDDAPLTKWIFSGWLNCLVSQTECVVSIHCEFRSLCSYVAFQIDAALLDGLNSLRNVRNHAGKPTKFHQPFFRLRYGAWLWCRSIQA